MSLPALPSYRADRSETSIISSSDSSISDAEFDSIAEEPDSSIDSASADNSDENAVPAIRSHTPTNAKANLEQRCEYSWPALSAIRGLAELVWHGAGRAVNAGAFVILSNAPASGMRITASVMTGIAAGGCGYRFVATRTGGGPCGMALATAAGIVSGVAAGTASYYGSGYPGLMIAAASVVAFGASHVQQATHNVEETAPLANAVPPTLVVAVSGASIAVASLVPGLRAADPGKLGRRTMALLAEAVTVEFFKGTTERMIPGADRSRLSFERKLKAGLIGMLPYAFASVTFSGVFGNLLRAQMKSDRFEDHFAPLLLGALASVVKGAMNTALIRCGGNFSACGPGVPDNVREAEGLRCTPSGLTLQKAALRFVIASARDVLYLSLVDSGLDEISAACLAYSLYAFFAQHRELMFDMMQGEGWTEPTLTPHREIASA